MATRSTRAYTSPWPSVESLNTAPAIKKRHSVYAISDLPPPRHPARVSADHPPGSRRPSTASGVVVSSWEEPSRKGKASSDTPSVKSRTSSLGLSMRTGPVEEVAPWELYPVPASPLTKNFKASTTSIHLKNRKSFASTSTAHISPSSSSLKVSTGTMEEVTPWELLPGPSLSDLKPTSPVSLKQSSLPPLSPPSRPLPNLEHESVPVYPRSTATGPTEDVTPWELTPAPADGQEFEISADVGTMPSLSLTMAQVEQVTPWELYPAPKSNGSATTRPSNKPLSDAGNRPRKSNSSKTAKTTRSSIPATGISNMPHESTAFIGQQKGFPSNGVNTVNLGASPTASSSNDSKQPERQDLKFSTADLTILEQLKMNIRAREDQFVVKGIGNLAVGGAQSAGKKHHPYPAKEVPYPRSYEKEVVDLDVWETMFCLDICKSLTWHVLETPPTKVLELGCGTGTWILHCAQKWKECHFVGLDIVPLHPDLRNVDSPDLASRITWVQHNFLDGLPFQNEEFDFVHIKRIALGVPENKWDKFFEEVARVMKPGAAFEMVEEDLFFPGKNIEASITDDFLSSITSHWDSTFSEHRNGFPPNNNEPGSPQTPTTTNTTLPPRTPSRSNSPAPGSARKENEEVTLNEEQSLISYDSFSSPSLPAIPSPSLPTISVPVSIAPANSTRITFPTVSTESNPMVPLRRSNSRPLLSVQNEQLYSSDSGLTGTNPAGFGSSLSSAIGSVNKALMSRIRSSSTDAKPSASSLNPAAALSDSELKPTTKPSPLLLQTLTETPINPRNHTLLETIWNEMLSSRWVNPAPLSSLKTYLEWHFIDVRTHPPFMYTFPPTAPEPIPADDDSESNPVTDDSPKVASLLPKRASSIKSSNDAPHGDDKEHPWLSLQSLQQQQYSPYVPLDTFSPSQQGSLASKRMSRLPTATLNVDLRTLNLHLALRSKEIIACSEAMWEWVEQFQQESASSIPNLNAPSTWSLDITRCAILEMTREDFDILLNNFTLDFQDQAAVNYALQERFDWHVLPTWQSQDRIVFDEACEKYQKWVSKERDKSSLQQSQHQSNGVIPDARNSSTPNINSSIHTQCSSTVITRSYSSPESTFQNASDDGTNLTDTSQPSDPAIRPSSQSSPSASHLTPELMPTQKLSRSMRVFVAWKASS